MVVYRRYLAYWKDPFSWGQESMPEVYLGVCESIHAGGVLTVRV